MKTLSITVPCYNSQEYMRNCVDSLLKGGEDVEILIVDDGSKDDTLKIAKEYEEKYPTIVKAIHQENKGHGGAVNTGLAHATGLYFKVVDSDDWLNEEAFRKAIEVLKQCVRGPKTLDLLICNYVYEKVGAKRKTVMRYRSALPQITVLLRLLYERIHQITTSYNHKKSRTSTALLLVCALSMLFFFLQLQLSFQQVRLLQTLQPSSWYCLHLFLEKQWMCCFR